MDSQPSSRLFPSNLPLLEYTEFQALGFTSPACGVIYHKKARPEQGMPLGGLDTGRIGLEADGTFGYCTIFNSICRSSVTICPALNLFFAIAKFLSRPTSLDSLGPKKLGQVSPSITMFRGPLSQRAMLTIY